MRISIFGLGYIGTITGLCLAESRHQVVGVDIDPLKLKCFKNGRSPIIEPGISEFVENNTRNKRFSVTSSIAEAIANSDISMICVGTPAKPDGSLNLDYVESVCRDIALALKEKDTFHIIVLRSTVLPGTTRDLIIPTLEKFSGKKAGNDFGFASNPEFLRQGNAIEDYYYPPKIVIGTNDPKIFETVSEIYKAIDAPCLCVSVEVAEAIKYANNAWHALKIGFSNELGNILKEHEIDSHQVMDIFCLDTKLNISTAYLKPGFAFGGSCLPKDVQALCASARKKGLQTPIFDSLLKANDQQIQRAYNMIKETGRKNVGLLGLSFKQGTDDLRQSPFLTLTNLLIKDSFEVLIYDPCVYEAATSETTVRDFIKKHAPHIAQCLVETPEQLLSGSDVFVIGNRDQNYMQVIEKANDNIPIIDLVRLKNSTNIESRKYYNGICW